MYKSNHIISSSPLNTIMQIFQSTYLHLTSLTHLARACLMGLTEAIHATKQAIPDPSSHAPRSQYNGGTAKRFVSSSTP
jgi:hypothetical protein